jgi:putative redox protein
MSQTPIASEKAESALVEETGAGRFQVVVHAGGSAFLADEPIAVGGLGSGPNPYDLMSAALGSCTAMTVRLYASRKVWPLKRVRVRVEHVRATLDARDRFEREIIIEGDLDDAQRKKLLDIANHCPVHRTLERGADVATVLAPPGPSEAAPDLADGGQHMRHMKEACA